MPKDLRFPDRAIATFVKIAKLERLSPRQVRDVVRYAKQKPDHSQLIPLLQSENEWTRKYTVEALGGLGHYDEIINLASTEDDKMVLLAITEQLVKTKNGLEKVANLLNSEDGLIKESVIMMFVRAKRADCLFTLLFDDNHELVSRIQKYMKEEK